MKSWKLLEKKCSQYHPLPEDTIDKWEEFWNHLIQANQIHNLTAITELHEAMVKHFLDSWLIPASLEGAFPMCQNLLDFGCGGGFPGIPLHLGSLYSELILVDARSKKLGVLQEICEKIPIRRVSTVHENWNPPRAKAWVSQNKKQIDLCTARAVASPVELLPILTPLSPSYLVLPQGAGFNDAEWEKTKTLARKLGWKTMFVKTFNVEFFEIQMTRNILIFANLKK